MLRFLMILAAVVIFVALAVGVAIHTDATRWAEAAVALFMASFLVDGVGPAGPWVRTP